MKHVYVKFREADQIVEFVKLMSQCDYDVDVKCGSRVVDGKSLVGVLSMAKAKTVEVVLHTDDCGDLLDLMAPYAA